MIPTTRIFAVALAAILAAPLAAPLATPLATPARAQSPSLDAARGRTVAARWCFSCHVESPATAERLLPEVPAFSDIASKGELTPARLTAIFSAPHAPMPELDLSRQQTADLSAYVNSLAP